MFYIVIMVVLGLGLVCGVAMAAFGQRATGSLVAIVAAICGICWTAAFSWTSIGPAMVGVQTTFGAVNLNDELPEGGHWTRPWVSVAELDTQQILIEIKTDPGQPNTSIAMTKDEIPLTTLDVGFPVQMNPAMAPRVYGRFRGNYVQTLLVPAAHSAVREAATRLTWREATVQKRDEFTRTLHEEFSASVRRNLVAAGLTQQEADAAFVIPGVQLRAVLPPARILGANAERQAASVDLERQQVLTQIAEQEAVRRRQEGIGIRNLFEQLPEGYSTQDVLNILTAVARKEEAEAMHRAVVDGRVQTMVIPYGSSAPIASGAPGTTVPPRAAPAR